MVKVLALQNVIVGDEGKGVAMRAGGEYTLTHYGAFEAQRAGYVRVLAQPGRETATAPAYETATAPAQEIYAPDRLAAINGIGKRTQEALHVAGVLTFRQLAEADPDALALALDGSSPAQVRKWQADAVGFLA